MNTKSTRSERKRGIVAPFVATMLIVLVGAVALSVDVGHMVVANSEMQNAVDASALAGASGLQDGNDAAMYRAYEYAAGNNVAGSKLAQGETNVAIGNWNGESKKFFPLGGGELRTPNAVKIVGTRPNFQFFFAQVLGFHSTLVDQNAVASAGSGTCAGVWGLNHVRGHGSIIVDSYDSSDGAYGPGNRNANGDICSNRDIVVSGGVEIYGDVMYGEDYDITINGNSHEIWGLVDNHSGEMVPPPFDMPGAQASNDNASIGLTSKGTSPWQGNGWSLKLVSNENLTLNTGTYYFDSVSMAGQSTLTIAGQVEIFVSGTANFTGGGLVNPGQDPGDLVIYSTGNTLKIGGNSSFYGAVIAPDTDVTLAGTSDYYGTIMAGDLELAGDTIVHVDEQLVFNLFGLDPVRPILVE